MKFSLIKVLLLLDYLPWHAERDGGIAMEWKLNKEIVPLAKAFIKNMTKGEKHFWYDF